MEQQKLNESMIPPYKAALVEAEKSAATAEKYLRDVRAFARWLAGRAITKEAAAAWKARLVELGYAPASVNAMLSALNSLLDFLGRGDCRVKFLDRKSTRLNSSHKRSSRMPSSA